MIRRSFLKRMALAAAACAFIDVPWPKQASVYRVAHIEFDLGNNNRFRLHAHGKAQEGLSVGDWVTSDVVGTYISRVPIKGQVVAVSVLAPGIHTAEEMRNLSL